MIHNKHLKRFVIGQNSVAGGRSTREVDRVHDMGIVVAHRLCTICDANQIYSMEDGQIAQSGTYDDLSRQDGLFRRMIARQVA